MFDKIDVSNCKRRSFPSNQRQNMAAFLATLFILFMSHCLVTAFTETPSNEANADAEKQKMIVRMFNETQWNVKRYEAEVQDWFSSLNDSYFLNNSISDINKEIKRMHNEVGSAILHAFEKDPASLVVVQLGSFGREMTAQLLLRQHLINSLKSMIAEHKQIAAIRKKEARVRRDQETANPSQKANLVREEEHLVAERRLHEAAIVSSSRERLESQQDNFWRDLFENVGRLIEILSRIWRLIANRYAATKGYE